MTIDTKLMRYLLVLLLLAGCMSPSSKSSAEAAAEAAAAATASASQQSSHASESKQGTNSMPVILICNANNSPNASCATLPKDNPLQPLIRKEIKSAPPN